MKNESSDIEISIVIPCYNGAQTIANNVPDFIDFLNTQSFSYEIIIVDDGSDTQEKTKEVADQLACKFIGLKENKGKGGAVKAGMQMAIGNYRIFTDVDIPFQ